MVSQKFRRGSVLGTLTIAGQSMFAFNRRINSNSFPYIDGKKLCPRGSLGPELKCLFAHWVSPGCSSLRKKARY